MPQVVGGIYAHSLAIITDAAHLLSDVSGFAVAVLAAYWAKRASQEHFSYGYHRVEVRGGDRDTAGMRGCAAEQAEGAGRRCRRPPACGLCCRLSAAALHPPPCPPRNPPSAGAGRAGVCDDGVAGDRHPAV